jgi:hypothetical protein
MWVGSGGNDQLCGGVGVDTMSGAQRGIGFTDESIQACCQRLVQFLEKLDPLGERFARSQDGHRNRIVLCVGSAACQRVDERESGFTPVFFAHCAGAPTSIAVIWLIAAVRVFIPDRRAISNARSAVVFPSFGVATLSPPASAVRAAL